MTRPLSPLLTAVLPLALAGCFDLETLLDPPDPEILDVSASCEGGVLSLEALVESDLEVSNLVVEVADIDAEPLDPMFPVRGLDNAGPLSRWDLEIAHDCDASIALSWTAWTVLETSATADSAWPDVSLDGGALDPAHGSDAGGSEIALSGAGMDEIDAVWFGDAEATLVSATPTALVVSTPPGIAYETVDVRLQAGVTEETLAAAFTYWPDAEGQITGLVRLVTHVYDTRWFNIGSAYTTLSPYGPFVQHEALMHWPVDPIDAYPSFYPAPGGCVTNDVAYDKIDAGGYLTLDAPETGALPLVSSGGDTPNYWYVEADVDPADWSGLVFDFVVPAETDLGPALTLPDAVVHVDLPATTSFDWQAAGELTRGDDLVFTWTGGDAERVWWTLYPGRGTSALSSITCMADATTGVLTVPWEDALAGADPSRVTTFFARLGFHRDDRTAFDHDNSELWSLSEVNYWLAFNVVD